MEIHVIDVMTKSRRSVMEGGITLYEASTDWIGDGLKPGVLIIFETTQERDDWWKGRP